MLACTVLAIPLFAAGYTSGHTSHDSQRGTPRKAETATGLRTAPDVGLRAATDRAGRHGETDASRNTPSLARIAAPHSSDKTVRPQRTSSAPPPLYKGHSAAYWEWKYRWMRHLAYQRLLKLRASQRQHQRTLMSSPSVAEAINLAATVYGHGATLWALARCESQLNPTARNASGSSGLMQFMPSTFASTPFGRFSIWSPYANALAAGWMLEQGRRSEWVC